jgi:nitrite reductase/ring-hydroxylating ferredoxin subunit
MTTEMVRVAARSDVPLGALFYVNVDGLPIALANVAGTIYAIGDACRHQGGPLSAGVLIDASVTCPWHGWTYDVRSGKSIVPPIGLRLPTYPVRVEGDDVFVVIEWPDA